MRVYTFQKPDVLAILQQGLPYYARWSFADVEPMWQPAYRWMHQQYMHRIGIPLAEDQALIWVWKKKPPKRDYRYYAGNILFTLEVEPDRILFSDFERWHIPLNPFDLLSGRRTAEQVHKSWENVFVLRSDKDTQGVIDAIYPHQLVEWTEMIPVKAKRF